MATRTRDDNRLSRAQGGREEKSKGPSSAQRKQIPPGQREGCEKLQFQGRHPSWLLDMGAIRHAVPSGPSDDTPMRTECARWPSGAGHAKGAAAFTG